MTTVETGASGQPEARTESTEAAAAEEEGEGAAATRAALLRHPRVHLSAQTLPRRAPRRVVSLVPSLSEAIVVLGTGDRLVGVTEYCVHPAEAFRSLPKLGGTKDADVDAITACHPDLVIANREENTERVVRKLAERGIDVWLTYPRTVRGGVELLAAMAEVLDVSAEARSRHVEPAWEAVAAAEIRRAKASAPGPRTFCPIWREPWMTIGQDTYIHDVIALCGGRNVFAGPGAASGRSAGSAGDRRYPIVEIQAIEAARPEVILLPDEPYAFGPGDAEELGRIDCAAARTGRIHLIDGTLLSWYGPRIVEAIQVLAPILARA
jgi:ABC-type hemin transport system substrate-binding protein